ncbi:MAG: ferredoxin [Mucilaginibacter sp.]|nr:ferredoxin [Mucilaginibacter sp.]
MINFIVESHDGQHIPISVPEGISLNLMEVLKASDYDILATCGGMALCATCMVQVLKGGQQLASALDQELDMLDRMPASDDKSRLSCQIAVNEQLEGCVFKIAG